MRTPSAFVLLLTVLLTMCLRPSHAEASGTGLIHTVLTIKYICEPNGAPKEYVELAVEEDGGLSTGLNPKPNPPCASVPLDQLTPLTRLLQSEAFIRAIEPYRIKPLAAPFRRPTVLLFHNDSIYVFSATALPPEVMALVATVDRFFERACPGKPSPSIGAHLKASNPGSA